MGRVNFLKQLDLANSYMLSTKNEEGYSFLVKITKFVDEGSFINSKRRKQFIKLRNLADNEIASVMSITEASVRRLKMEVSDKLYELFSEKFFDILYSGNLEECRLIFGVVSGEMGIEDICNYSVSILASPYALSGVEYEVGECLEELKFLARHSNTTMLRELDNLDTKKLGYLLRLAQDGGDLKKRIELAKVWRNLHS